MKKVFYLTSLSVLWLFSCSLEDTTVKITFGSCGSHKDPLPMLDIASGLDPDVFIFLGDNVYGDTRDMNILREKYDSLGSRPEFQRLWSSTEVLATWDDHDYGENDAGRHYPNKEESKAIFLEFWKVPENSERRNHPGIYGAEYLVKDGLIVQFILLDTRTFRDNLQRVQASDSLIYKNDYKPNLSPDSTFLGEDQWKWLENELERPADIRIIASSNQFSHEYNGWESWTNVPHEQRRMINLINKTKASGVIFISGDVHWGEISKLENSDGYPIYDVTSSGIVQTWHHIEPNSNRLGSAVPQNNIGLITINKTTEIEIQMEIIDSTGLPVVSEKINIDSISF